MRNLLEYTKGSDDAQYIKLTSLLHWKNGSDEITENELFAVYNALFGTEVASADGAKLVVELIQEQAAECLLAAEGTNFENKIVMSIAVRLKAEQFMVARIDDAAVVNAITSTQTPKLLHQFRARFGGETLTIQTIERVILMTPENIHLNAFMYEPILDMSDDHLRQLYTDVVALAPG